MSTDSPLQSYVEAVKATMRDRPDLNALIEGEEHKDEDRVKALEEALDWLNSTPPLTEYTFVDCPFRRYLIDLSIIRLLRSLLYLLERNALEVSDPGGVAATKTQRDYIRRTIQELRAEVLPELKEAKKARALMDSIAYSGSVGSSYYGNNW